jgi:glycosyltransferase involved in cell wall biosynthesis
MKRNQAIFSHLLESSAFEEGLYVYPPIVRNVSTTPEWRLPYAAERLRTEVVGKPVTTLEPVLTLPFTWRTPVMEASAALIAREIAKRIAGRPYVLWMNSLYPLSVGVAERLAPAAQVRIFDSSDDFIEFETGKRRQEAERCLTRVLAVADRVLAVNEHVCAKLHHSNKRVFLNCTDFENFQRTQPGWTLQPYFPKRPGDRYIGFIGGLNHLRVDLELLEKLFRRFSDCQFLFVGYTNDPAIQTWLKAFPNAVFVPEVPYTDLPNVIHSFDVAIVPHLDNENTRGNDLLKMLDYFACGVPVVTTRCSNVDKYAGACRIAETHDEFANSVEQLLRGTVVHDPQPGLAIARSRTWRHQVGELTPWVLSRVTA